jgi:SPP1 gp7 family putative phage head morphogenesis protein
MKRRTSQKKAKAIRKELREQPPANPIKQDPTRTAGLRRQFEQELRRRFHDLRQTILETLIKDDGLGLTVNAGRWAGRTDVDKIKAFRQWLETQLKTKVLGQSEDELYQRFIEEGFKKGAGRAFEDANKTERVLADTTGKLDFYEGTKAQFLSSSFAQPVAIEKVKLLAARTYGDLKGITDDLATRLTRKLTDGLVRGLSPRDIGREISVDLDLGAARATTIARTEIIRAHAEGQLQALENLGVQEVGVAVEWATAGDNRVCPMCAPLQGVILKLEEAKGMIPRHPNCRCAWIPANVGESKEGQKATRSTISKSIDRSKEHGGTEDDTQAWGPGQPIAGKRPKSSVGS